MTQPLVSAHMITYNHAPYIVQAIEGVLKQRTDFLFELVIGEDCSIDGTREIVFEYQRRHPNTIRVITSDKNVGGRENNYRNIKACRGKYIAFCEGDDYWHSPDKLQKQVDYLESHPECGLVYSGYDVYFTESGKKIDDFIKYRNWKMPEPLDVAHIVEGGGAWGVGILTCTVMLRRSLYEQIVESDPYLHQSGHFLMGDTQLWAEMASLSDLHYIPESLATHNITPESATRSKDIKKELRFFISRAELGLYLCNKYNLPSRIRNKCETDWCSLSLRLAYRGKRAELADEVRRKKNAFTIKEWLQYCGATVPAVYYVLRIAGLLRNAFRKRRYGTWE
jgi:glycosyltransferase involved in cell wall biosynthesis